MPNVFEAPSTAYDAVKNYFLIAEQKGFFLLLRTQVETARRTVHRRGSVGRASCSGSLELDIDRKDSKNT